MSWKHVEEFTVRKIENGFQIETTSPTDPNPIFCFEDWKGACKWLSDNSPRFLLKTDESTVVEVD